MSMIFINKVLSFLTSPKNGRIIVAAILFILITLLLRQCEKTRTAEWETTRIGNNLKASNDTIRNYIDKNGNSAAEIRALTLTLKEAKGMVKFNKTRPPVTIIKYETQIVERIVKVPVISIDTAIGKFNSAAIIESEDSWGKSSRKIKTTVPYSFENGKATFGNAAIDLDQNIFLTASILRDKKTKEVFVNLSTDYPGTTFNSAQGIMIDSKSSGFRDLQFKSRKSFGVGVQLGIGISGTNLISPYVGLGINYTPKFLQW